MALNQIKTEYGVVSGVPGNDPAITVFRGVPYAKPPVGNLRFAAPESPDSWEGTLQCDTWPSPCIQYRRNVLGAGGKAAIGDREYIPDGSEDCLYLNIWTPANAAGEKLPVMFWIHGGGFNTGWNSSTTYRGEALVKKGVVLVAVGFRSGPMGFIAHPELDARSPRGVSGNYGMLDQVKALEWVRDNIASFGGDPDCVTIFGHSSGGISCKFHLCSPLSRGLFRRAIIMAGGGLNAADPCRPREALSGITQQCLDRLGWTVSDLLTRDGHEVSKKMGDVGEAILDGKELFAFQPSIDGYFLIEEPEQTIAGGRYFDTDIICGTVKGDSWMFSRKVRHLLTDQPDVLRAFAYSPGSAWAKNQAEKGGSPIHTYFFERDQGSGYTPHGSDVPYVFGTLENRVDHIYSDYDHELSEAIITYWSQFAKTGDPNGTDLPEWPKHTAELPFTMHFTDDDYRAEDIVDGEIGAKVIAFTQTHPGMLHVLDEFPFDHA